MPYISKDGATITDVTKWRCNPEQIFLAEDSVEYLAYLADKKTSETLQQEIDNLKTDMTNFMAYHFSMTQTIYELGVAKGLWAVTDIDDTVLKQKFTQWKPKVERYRELND